MSATARAKVYGTGSAPGQPKAALKDFPVGARIDWREAERGPLSGATAAEASPGDVKSVQLELVDEAPARGKVGRPLILTKRTFLKICHLVETGVATPAACRIEQVRYRIFRQRVAASPRLTARLRKATDTRFDLRHEEALAIVMAHAPRNWQAAAWLLERCLPGSYSLRPVARPDSSEEPAEEHPPAEVLARHRALLLELAREDEARSANPPEMLLVRGPGQVPEQIGGRFCGTN